ncbi:hypothetical protein HYW18_00545 [Candidatus Uhrbacteria bacterium]|nr:hypothetical protein [Candidatus Uhrbacteria bacterium]
MFSRELLLDLRWLFEGWGISPNDWYVTGEAAMHVWGYPITMREGQMDILVCRSAWPWPRSLEQVSLLPDTDTEGDRALQHFVEKHGMHLDIHPLPHVGLSAEDRLAHTDWYPDPSHVRALLPWAGVLHRKLIVEFYESDPTTGLAAFDQKKFLRWNKFVEEVEGIAQTKSDTKTIETCQMVYPAIARAIAFFDKGAEEIGGATEELRGSGAFPGLVTGEAVLWKNDTDVEGKIVILDQALPSHITALRTARGIVTNQGGLLSHAATIAREFGIPTVIGTRRATSIISDGDIVELDGETGIVRLCT